MEQSAASENIFTWIGSGSGDLHTLEAVPWITSVVDRCKRLRFTGQVELLNADGETIAFQPWFGGKSHTADPSSIILAGQDWFMGPAATGSGPCAAFRVTQYIPDFDDRLTDGIALRGKLIKGTAESIATLCSKHLLCAEVVLQKKSGEVAEVGFTYGRAESAAISGVSQLASQALALVLEWNHGSYQVRLRPLFSPADSSEPLGFASL